VFEALIQECFGAFNWWQRLLIIPVFGIYLFLWQFGQAWLHEYKVAKWKKQLDS